MFSLNKLYIGLLMIIGGLCFFLFGGEQAYARNVCSTYRVEMPWGYYSGFRGSHRRVHSSFVFIGYIGCDGRYTQTKFANKQLATTYEEFQAKEIIYAYKNYSIFPSDRYEKVGVYNNFSEVVNGVCGSIHDHSSHIDLRKETLCEAGDYDNLRLEGSYWKWDCLGINNGSNVSCNAYQVTHHEGLCKQYDVSIFATAIKKGGPSKNYTIKYRDCNGNRQTQSFVGDYGHMSFHRIEAREIISASGNGTYEEVGLRDHHINAQCGSAHGIPTNTPPTGGASLCSEGVLIGAVIGPSHDPKKYTWTCQGLRGGMNAVCEAPYIKGDPVEVCETYDPQHHPNTAISLGSTRAVGLSVAGSSVPSPPEIMLTPHDHHVFSGDLGNGSYLKVTLTNLFRPIPIGPYVPQFIQHTNPANANKFYGCQPGAWNASNPSAWNTAFKVSCEVCRTAPKSYAWEVGDWGVCTTSGGSCQGSYSVTCEDYQDKSYFGRCIPTAPQGCYSQKQPACGGNGYVCAYRCLGTPNPSTVSCTSLTSAQCATKNGCSWQAPQSTQTRTVVCKDNTGALVDDSLCPSPKPDMTQSCGSDGQCKIYGYNEFIESGGNNQDWVITYEGYSFQPARDTPTGCIVGPFEDISDSTSHWMWRCIGKNGGKDTMCSAPKPTEVSRRCSSWADYTGGC